MSNTTDFVIENGVLKKYVGTNCEIIVPENVISIGVGAFAGCSQLVNIYIPNSVTHIGGKAFWGCKNLETLQLSNSLQSFGLLFSDPILSNTTEFPSNLRFNTMDQIDYIGSKKNPHMIACKPTEINIKEARIAEGCIYIYPQAFKQCKELVSVSFPKTLRCVSYEAFKCCNMIKSIVLPDNITNIGEDAFSRCISLEELIISANANTKNNKSIHNIFRTTPKLKKLLVMGKAFWYLEQKKMFAVECFAKAYLNEEITNQETIDMYLSYFRKDNPSIYYRTLKNREMLIVLLKSYEDIPDKIEALLDKPYSVEDRALILDFKQKYSSCNNTKIFDSLSIE